MFVAAEPQFFKAEAAVCALKDNDLPRLLGIEESLDDIPTYQLLSSSKSNSMMSAFSAPKR